MEEMRQLYKERKMTALLKLCQEQEAAGSSSFGLFAHLAYVHAARNNLSRLSLGQGAEYFGKASELAGADSEKKKELYENFTKEILLGMEKTQAMFEDISLTADVILSYRDYMKINADALVQAAEVGEEAGCNVLAVLEEAVLCMVRLCAVYKYDQDLGKAVVHKVDNAPAQIREEYNAKYDQLTEKIRGRKADYEAPEIQREAEEPAPSRTQVKEEPGKKKGLIDKLLDFF